MGECPSPEPSERATFAAMVRPGEKIVWELLRAERMDGIKFRRQHPIGPCFADFACIST